VNFHIGVGKFDAEELAKILSVPADEHVGMTSSSMLNNGRAIADVICRGVCHRYPDMKFVSVESGAGWLPYLAESMDWHWRSFGAHKDFPDRELPSFYLRRQVYGSFWFEKDIGHAVDLFPDNIMFETDFPHPTSLSPGPASPATHPLLDGPGGGRGAFRGAPTQDPLRYRRELVRSRLKPVAVASSPA